MREYAREMNQRALEAKEQAARNAQLTSSANISMPAVSTVSNTATNSALDTLSSDSTRIDPTVSLANDEGERNLISNEIQLFRDRFKDEDTKMRNTEKERKDRYERERALQREKRSAEEAAANGNNKSTLSPSLRHSPSSSSRDRSSRRHDRNDNANRRNHSSPNSDDRSMRNSSSRTHSSNPVRSRANDRRSSPLSRYCRRSPVTLSCSYGRRSRTKSPVSRNHVNNEEDDETYERKKQERRLREKEIRYREVSDMII